MIGRLLGRRRPTREDAAGLPWESMYPDHSAPAIARPAVGPRSVRSLAAATTPATIAAANPDRLGLSIANDSTATLYVKHGPGAAAIAGGYTVKLGPGATYTLEGPDCYLGELTGVWSAVNGAAAITEQR